MGKIENLDFKKNTLRKINNYLQNISYKNNKREFTVKNPSGHHAICAGLTENISVKIDLPLKKLSLRVCMVDVSMISHIHRTMTLNRINFI